MVISTVDIENLASNVDLWKDVLLSIQQHLLVGNENNGIFQMVLSFAISTWVLMIITCAFKSLLISY